MLGDTPYDIEAAGKAGVGVIVFRCGGWGDTDLASAIAVYDDPADLLARLDKSPLTVNPYLASARENWPPWKGAGGGIRTHASRGLA